MIGYLQFLIVSNVAFKFVMKRSELMDMILDGDVASYSEID